MYFYLIHKCIASERRWQMQLIFVFAGIEQYFDMSHTETIPLW